jgi:hypothetical protein
MKKVLNQVLFVLLAFITLFRSACGTKTYRFTGTEIIEDKIVKFRSPLGEFWSTSDKLIISAKSRDGRITFNKDLPGARYTVSFSSFNEKYTSLEKYYGYLFNPQLDWEEYEKELQAKDNMLEVEARWHGYRLQKVYLNNLACGLVSYSRSPFDYMASSANKSYSLECGYYAKDGTKKVFDIYHFYQTNLSQKAFTHGDVVGKNYQGKYSPVMFVEQDFQRRAKHMIESIELKEIDMPRMKREGLYHEGKGKEFHYPVW